ncbi:hypothetical protein [Salinarimonas sp.]|uniref:hypothetical protein n=1 Tax=Salinarimonas sp. TaxID=2766526 RepID=UPI0032D90E69
MAREPKAANRKPSGAKTSGTKSGGTKAATGVSKATASKSAPEKPRTSPQTPADATERPPTPDMAPHASAERMTGDHAPPDDPRPNPAMLKADVNSGRTADKNEVFDPGMSMLGTDDEVAGHPASPERIRMAREQETSRSTAGAAQEPRANIGRTGRGRVVTGFVIGIVLFAVLFALILLGAG